MTITDSVYIATIEKKLQDLEREAYGCRMILRGWLDQMEGTSERKASTSLDEYPKEPECQE